MSLSRVGVLLLLACSRRCLARSSSRARGGTRKAGAGGTLRPAGRLCVVRHLGARGRTGTPFGWRFSCSACQLLFFSHPVLCAVLACKQLAELHALLRDNYVEAADASFRFHYSAEFLRWALQPPGCTSDWHVGVRAERSGALLGFISGIPTRMMVHGRCGEGWGVGSGSLTGRVALSVRRCCLTL
jgi:hypothetical protein